jgi:predicted oxidoreductase
MMTGQARRSGLVMGFDTHMIAGSRICSTSTRLTHPTITNQTTPHFAEALESSDELWDRHGPVRRQPGPS